MQRRSTTAIAGAAVGATPSPGYVVAEQRERPDDVEVRFQSSPGRTTIRVRLQGGQVQPEVKEDPNAG